MSLDLSVVIPAYNEAERLPGSLRRILTYLAAWGGSYEILVIDDGSSDGTAQRAQEVAGGRVRVLQNPGNRGKGYSVRRGMLAASGARRLMTDADLSTPIEDLPRLMARMDDGVSIVIGSRALDESKIEVHQPWYRENMGRVFNLFVRLLMASELHDTQCGFKLFSAEAADAVFRVALMDGFVFDVEALFLAQRRGYQVAEVPVTWRNDAASRVGLLKGFRAFPDLLRIRANEWRGRYRQPKADSC
ncbi:MAG TPA: dolichyl-phosphate beta-glucosyltransferase [Vicinamibacteria bacterium]|nr:dolichyl-phosphate beta-glucosyltransferase [Vicinamibacteria bacterium]